MFLCKYYHQHQGEQLIFQQTQQRRQGPTNVVEKTKTNFKSYPLEQIPPPPIQDPATTHINPTATYPIYGFNSLGKPSKNKLHHHHHHLLHHYFTIVQHQYEREGERDEQIFFLSFFYLFHFTINIFLYNIYDMAR